MVTNSLVLPLHIYITPSYPSINGLVERAKRTLLEMIKTQIPNNNGWPRFLLCLLVVHNSTYHSALGQSPNVNAICTLVCLRVPLGFWGLYFS